MKTLTAEWVAKAEGDYASAGRELRARKSPNYDSCCFHSQQCAEKYLKPFLQENGQHIPKIHNLKELLEICVRLDDSFEFMRADLILIDRFSVRVRYPGVTAEKDEARSAFKALEATQNSSGKNWRYPSPIMNKDPVPSPQEPGPFFPPSILHP